MTFEQGMDKTAASNADKSSHNFQSELDSLYGPRSGDHRVAAATAPPGERATDQNMSLPGLQLTGLEDLGKSFDPGAKIAGAQDNRDNIDNMPKVDPWKGKDLDPGFSPREHTPINGDPHGKDLDPGFEIGANKPSASSAVDSLPDLILF